VPVRAALKALTRLGGLQHGSAIRTGAAAIESRFETIIHLEADSPTYVESADERGQDASDPQEVVQEMGVEEVPHEKDRSQGRGGIRPPPTLRRDIRKVDILQEPLDRQGKLARDPRLQDSRMVAADVRDKRPEADRVILALVSQRSDNRAKLSKAIQGHTVGAECKGELHVLDDFNAALLAWAECAELNVSAVQA
jgi:hypothetical protein